MAGVYKAGDLISVDQVDFLIDNFDSISGDDYNQVSIKWGGG